MQCVFLFYEVSRIEVCYKNYHDPRRLLIISSTRELRKAWTMDIQRLSHCNPLPSQNHTKEKLLSRFPGCSLGLDCSREIEREDSFSFRSAPFSNRHPQTTEPAAQVQQPRYHQYPQPCHPCHPHPHSHSDPHRTRNCSLRRPPVHTYPSR